jgi:hypothetical protein
MGPVAFVVVLVIAVIISQLAMMLAPGNHTSNS